MIKDDFLATPWTIFVCLRFVLCGQIRHGSASSSMIGDLAGGCLPEPDLRFFHPDGTPF
ncbi:MAG: hypothetical protein H7838_06330 [Magnetococcus sp. DMHC-8]